MLFKHIEDLKIQAICRIPKWYFTMSTDYVVFNQVFKMVVQWSNGSKTVVYRRYSLFFDFLVSGENSTYDTFHDA